MTGTPATESLLAGVHSAIEGYYSTKIRTHGATPCGVDWSCAPTQELRFVQLLKLCDFEGPFSLNDIGCGYGALLGFLAKRHRRVKVDYLGTDLSQAMIVQARRLWPGHPSAQFEIADANPRVADYAIASGIFNVKLQQPIALWTLFIERTLRVMHACSRKGFAVNFVLPLGEDVVVRPELYRVRPAVWTAFCEDNLGSSVELLTGYGLREFTLLVRR